MIILGITIGTAFVENLYEYRVKSLNYGDVYSKMWEGPLLIIMYTSVVLIDAMMSCIFYFTCKCSSLESFDNHSLLEHNTSFSGSIEQANVNDSSPSKLLVGSQWIDYTVQRMKAVVHYLLPFRTSGKGHLSVRHIIGILQLQLSYQMLA